MDGKIMNRLNTPWNPVDYQNGIEDKDGNQVLFSDLHYEEKKFLCEAVNTYDSQQRELFDLTNSINKLENRNRNLEEDLECIQLRLDDLGADRADGYGNIYSIVGRINDLLTQYSKD